MEIHKTNQKNGVNWVTKVESEERAIEIIAQDSGFYPHDIKEELKTTGSFDSVLFSYGIEHVPTSA